MRAKTRDEESSTHASRRGEREQWSEQHTTGSREGEIQATITHDTVHAPHSARSVRKNGSNGSAIFFARAWRISSAVSSCCHLGVSSIRRPFNTDISAMTTQ